MSSERATILVAHQIIIEMDAVSIKMQSVGS